MLAAQGGVNVIYGAGMLENGLCFDMGKLILDCDIFRMIKHLMGGISITDYDMAVNVIKEIGPGGHFLSHEHTLNNFKTSLSQPMIFDRRTRESWLADGGKGVIENGYEEAIRILDSHVPLPLSEEVLKKLRSIVEEAEAELGV